MLVFKFEIRTQRANLEIFVTMVFYYLLNKLSNELMKMMKFEIQNYLGLPTPSFFFKFVSIRVSLQKYVIDICYSF